MSATCAGKMWEAARRCLDAASYEALRQQDDAQRVKAEAAPESLVPALGGCPFRLAFVCWGNFI